MCNHIPLEEVMTVSIHFSKSFILLIYRCRYKGWLLCVIFKHEKTLDNEHMAVSYLLIDVGWANPIILCNKSAVVDF